MAAEKPVQSLLPLEGTFYAVRLGAILILLSTTVPYLMLLNGFLFAGIFLAGVVALHKTILRFQVALTFREAFVLGCMVGFAGGVLSEAVSFFLIGLFHYRPERETLVFVIDKESFGAINESVLLNKLTFLFSLLTFFLIKSESSASWE